MANNSMGQLDNKVALVTGGSSGIGRATAQRFADEGAFVFITGRRQAELDAARKTLGGNSRAVLGDVSRTEDLDEIFAQIRRHGRGLDVLFANAGTGSLATLSDTTPEHFDETFSVNVRGTLPEEIASTVLFLASNQSSFVTGSELFADGGEEQY